MRAGSGRPKNIRIRIRNTAITVFQIRDPVLFRHRDPVSGIEKSRSGIQDENLDLIFESLVSVWVKKYSNACFDADSDPDPESGKKKVGSGINIPDPKHLVPTLKAAGLKSNNV
jgi:hypothetical protein